MFKKVFYILLFSLMVSNAYALNYYSFMYQVEDGDTFGLILKKFVQDTSIINAKTPLVKKTIKNNPHILQWSNLPKGSIIELYISDDFMDMKKYRPYEAGILKKIADKEEKKRESTYPSGLKASLFYMASVGTFNQKADQIAEIKFKQNSPLTFGGSFNFYPKDKLYSYSFSAYGSYLLATANSLTSEKISIPPEIGANLYYEYRLQNFGATVFSGIDYESFYVFNLRGLQNYGKVYVDGVGATYLTVGFAKSFTFFNRQLFSKLSISKSFLSSYKNNEPLSSGLIPDEYDTGKYSGSKFLFYLNYKFNDKFYLHTLFKYHSMSGPSNLSVLRVGVGFGYILF
ncbi:MAG: hypothetical protein Q7U04_02635 [Bacteriovorax sp.]|nr:hypothetical protein [Bacteriovorax sp.]